MQARVGALQESLDIRGTGVWASVACAKLSANFSTERREDVSSFGGTGYYYITSQRIQRALLPFRF
jgi:hypothetical protein